MMTYEKREDTHWNPVKSIEVHEDFRLSGRFLLAILLDSGIFDLALYSRVLELSVSQYLWIGV